MAPAVAAGIIGGGLGLGLGAMQASASASAQRQQQNLAMQSQMQQNEIAMQTQQQQMALAGQAEQQAMAQNQSLMNNLATDRMQSLSLQEQAFSAMPGMVSNTNPQFGGLGTVNTSMLGDTSTPSTARKTLLGN